MIQSVQVIVRSMNSVLLTLLISLLFECRGAPNDNEIITFKQVALAQVQAMGMIIISLL